MPQATCEEDNTKFNNRIIDALTPCVNRKLTHVVENTMKQPCMPEDFRARGVNIAFIEPLVNALCDAVTETAGTVPSGEDRITSRIKTDIFKLTVALTSAVIPTLTDIVKKNPKEILPITQIHDNTRNELKNDVKDILVDSLSYDSCIPTLNNVRLKEGFKRALIQKHNGEHTTTEECSCGIFVCCRRRGHSRHKNYFQLRDTAGQSQL